MKGIIKDFILNSIAAGVLCHLKIGGGYIC